MEITKTEVQMIGQLIFEAHQADVNELNELQLVGWWRHRRRCSCLNQTELAKENAEITKLGSSGDGLSHW